MHLKVSYAQLALAAGLVYLAYKGKITVNISK